jgi:hypothetical protein
MPIAAPATNRTEFARFLDVHEDAVPGLREWAARYRMENRTRHTFGLWLRDKHYAEFSRAYQIWWLKHPGKYGQDYSSPADLLKT